MAYIYKKTKGLPTSWLAAVGLAALFFGLGVGFAKNYTQLAYKQGYADAQAELSKGAFLDNKEIAKTACTEWWFGNKYRLHKGK